MTNLLEFVEANPIGGTFIISICTCVCVIVMGPYSVFAVGAGYTLKRAFDNVGVVLAVGTAAVFTGALVGGIIAFIFGKYLCRPQVFKYSQRNKILRALDTVMATQGLKLVFLLRLSLLVPYNLSNYAFGGMNLQLGHFILGTFGLIPMALFYVYVGTTVSDIQEAVSGNLKFTKLQIIVTTVGTTIAILGIIVVSCLVKRTLDRELKLSKQEN